MKIPILASGMEILLSARLVKLSPDAISYTIQRIEIHDERYLLYKRFAA